MLISSHQTTIRRRLRNILNEIKSLPLSEVSSIGSLNYSFARFRMSFSNPRARSPPSLLPPVHPNDSSVNPLFSFGLISDIQYADHDEKTNYSKTEMRHYRHALTATAHAIAAFKQENRIKFIVHGGDLIDGVSGNYAADGNDESLKVVRNITEVLEGRRIIGRGGEGGKAKEAEEIDEIDKMKGRIRASDEELAGHPHFQVYHMFGNHELYNFPRSWWLQEFRLSENSQSSPNIHLKTLPTNTKIASMFGPGSSYLPQNYTPGQPDPSSAYYSISPHKKYRLLVLDSYDISLLGWPASHPHHEIANNLLSSYNTNKDLNSSIGLHGLDARFVKFGGGFSHAQLLWLESQLEECDKEGINVILFSHIPLHPDSCAPNALCWNYNDILELIKVHHSVVLCLGGHDHDGGEATLHCKGRTVPFLTCDAILVCPDARDSYARVDCYEDWIVIQGVDLMRSKKIQIQREEIAEQ